MARAGGRIGALERRSPADAHRIGARLSGFRSPPANVTAALVVVMVGVVSILTLPSMPGYDAFAWVVWGREIAHHVFGSSEPFITRGGPSWKPLPVLFTTLFGFFGAAPKLWVGFSRAGGLFGLFVAYRLAASIATDRALCPGSHRCLRLAGPIAGTVAAFGVFLTAGWTHYMLRGTSEPLVVTTTLAAIERHLAGHPKTAFASGVALTLMRPEAAPFLALYALWMCLTDRRLNTFMTAAAGLIAIPVGWIIPPWIGSSSPLEASIHARDYNGQLGPHPFLEVLRRATNLSVWPVLIAALVVTLLALRRRDWLTIALAGAGLGYVAIVEAMTLDHFPGLERFMLPAAAIACVLAGVGVAYVAAFAGGEIRSVAAAAALVAIATPFFSGRVTEAAGETSSARQAVKYYNQLVDAVDAVGGRRKVFPCTTSFAAVNHTAQTALAWALDVPLTSVLTVTDVNTSLRHTALAFFAPRNPATGGAPTAFVGGLSGHPIARVGIWRVFRVTRPHAPAFDACVGR